MNILLKSFSFFLLVFLCLNTTSCDDTIVCSFEDDQQVITDYLSANNLIATKRESGMHYIIEEEGIGTLYPSANSVVTVKYKGYFTDGTIFDENETGIEFQVSNVIVGWQEGLSLMKKQSKAQFFIPSSLAYGSQPVGGLNGRECSVIIFDVELEDFR